MQTLVQPEVVKKWDLTFASGSDKSYPNLDLVRLQSWYFGKNQGKLLEYGFGCGINLIYLLEKGYEIEALDASQEAKKRVALRLQKYPDLASRVTLNHIDPAARRLPYEDSTFDYVVCISVLSLLGSQERIQLLLSEFSRVMKPNAKMMIDVNASNSDFAREGVWVGNDIYENRGHSKKEMPFRCYCPKSSSQFVKLVEPFFTIDDVGYSAHKYMQSEINEFIICAHKGPHA